MPLLCMAAILEDDAAGMMEDGPLCVPATPLEYAGGAAGEELLCIAAILEDAAAGMIEDKPLCVLATPPE